jgi:N-acetylglucosamine-6-phosphate deacetylase
VNELRGRLALDGALDSGRVLFDGPTIASVERLPELAGEESMPIIAPGFVDLHVHGFGGCDPLEDLPGMAQALASAGTTAFQPTLFPGDPARLGDDCAKLWATAQPLRAGSRVVGIHCEGPFVNPAAAGALPVHDLAIPAVDALRAILGSATGDGRGVRTMTIAPELPGALDLVRELARCGVRASLGHSRATAADARRAESAGASGVTHLYNAMSGHHHREAGLVSAALLSDLCFAELIGDLVHVGVEGVQVALAARGPQGLALVSDALRGAGTGCDHFHSHGRDHLLREGAAYYPPQAEGGAPQLAGSACSQLEMVRRLTRAGAVSIAEALTMAAETPARALGLERELGVLTPGAAADIVVLEGDDLRLSEVWVRGEKYGTAF